MEMDNLMRQKNAYKNFLLKLGIGDLRSLGRAVGVARPTAKNKEELIGDIIAVETGEILPVEKSTRGAPVKDIWVNPTILEGILQIKKQYESSSRQDLFKDNSTECENVMEMHSSLYEEEQNRRAFLKEKMHTGQLVCINGKYALLPSDGNMENAVWIAEEVLKREDIRIGDVVCCEVKQSNEGLSAEKIFTINGLSCPGGERFSFEKEEAEYPTEKLRLYNDKRENNIFKQIDLFFPLGKGHRALITGEENTGKSELLLEIAKTLSKRDDLKVYVLLCGASPEKIGEWKRTLFSAEIVATEFSVEAEKQIFMADFLLEKAKRRCEYGRDVCFIVDSLSSLAHAYNATVASSGGKTYPCGLETKTVQYIKQFGGVARKFVNGSSFTMISRLTLHGEEFNDVLMSEIHKIVNVEWRIISTSPCVPKLELPTSLSITNEALLSASDKQEREKYLKNKKI